MDALWSKASVVGSFVLLFVTIWYAWQTQQMVREMRVARTASVRPSVHLDLGVVGGLGYLQVENVGVGPAVDVVLGVHVRSKDGLDQTAHVTAPILRSGQSKTLLLPTRKTGGFMPIATLISSGVAATMEGQCTDLDGRMHSINDSLDFSRVDRSHEGRWETENDRWPRNLEAISKELATIRELLEPKDAG